MKRKHNYPKIILLISILIMIILPWILQLEFVRDLIIRWLSFSNNPDYKIAYIQLIGSIVGTFLSIYGALYIQKEEQRVLDAKKKQECARKIYIELRTCFNELESIFKDTKLTYHLNKIQKEDIEKFCTTAIGRRLSINEKWVEALAGSGDVFCGFDTNMIYKYYFKLQVIQQALESKNVEEIRKVYVPYICWFVMENGTGLHEDIEHFMKKMDEITQV